jgi:hypothetical protein
MDDDFSFLPPIVIEQAPLPSMLMSSSKETQLEVDIQIQDLFSSLNERTFNLKQTLKSKKPADSALDLSRDESDCVTQKMLDESVVQEDISELV